jgi:hypothetical protein
MPAPGWVRSVEVLRHPAPNLSFAIAALDRRRTKLNLDSPPCPRIDMLEFNRPELAIDVGFVDPLGPVDNAPLVHRAVEGI